MSPLTWLPFGKKADPEPRQSAEKRSPASGPITGCDLSELSSLVLPFAQDPFGQLMPPPLPDAIRQSLALDGFCFQE